MKRLIPTYLFLLLPALVVTAQQTRIDNGGCNAAFAKFLVDQQVSESRSVSETDKRIRILTRSADFLWKPDQPTAREYFAEAFKVASDRFVEKGIEKKSDKGLTTYLPDYRFEVVRAIAKRDAEWAKRLIEQILTEYEKSAADRTDFDKRRETDQVMYIAQESVMTNPSLSWYLFRRVMRQPLDAHWYFALYSVARNDQPFAESLYRELLINYANETPRRMLFLSAYPFGSERILGVDRFQFGGSVPPNFIGDPSRQRQFIDQFIRRALNYASDPANLDRPPEENRQAEPVYMVSALQELEPIVVERFSDLLPRLYAARAQASSLLSAQMRKDLIGQDEWNTSLSRTFEERLELVEKADEEGKLTDPMIFGLVTWGKLTEEQFKKVEPWLDKIKEESARTGTINYFWFLRSQLAAREGRLADAQKYAAKVPEIDHRAILLFDIAEKQLKDVNDAASAYSTISDMEKVAGQMENSAAKARVFLGLANLYDKINHVYALDDLSDAIKVINRLQDPDMTTTTIHRAIRSTGTSFFAVFSMPAYDLEGTIRALSKNDFEMSLSNAKALEDKYLRTLAVIAVAQNCIDKPKPKPERKAKVTQ